MDENGLLAHLVARAARAQSVDLIEKDDARGGVLSSLEYLSHGPLALSNILGVGGNRFKPCQCYYVGEKL